MLVKVWSPWRLVQSENVKARELVVVDLWYPSVLITVVLNMKFDVWTAFSSYTVMQVHADQPCFLIYCQYIPFHSSFNSLKILSDSFRRYSRLSVVVCCCSRPLQYSVGTFRTNEWKRSFASSLTFQSSPLSIWTVVCDRLALLHTLAVVLCILGEVSNCSTSFCTDQQWFRYIPELSKSILVLSM